MAKQFRWGLGFRTAQDRNGRHSEREKDLTVEAQQSSRPFIRVIVPTAHTHVRIMPDGQWAHWVSFIQIIDSITRCPAVRENVMPNSSRTQYRDFSNRLWSAQLQDSAEAKQQAGHFNLPELSHKNLLLRSGLECALSMLPLALI